MSRHLLSCPFCGSPAKLLTGRVAEDAENARVQCTKCFASTDDFEDAYAPTDQAVAAWNQRSGKGPAPDVGDELVKALEEAAGHLGAAKMQASPSDDQIIAGHVRDAYELVTEARRLANAR